MTDTFDTPPGDDVFQEDEGEGDRVPVIVENIVRVDEMPTAIGGMHRTIITTTAEKILNADARRKMVTLVSLDQDIYLAPSFSEANPSGAALWPANVPLVLQSSDELWAASFASTTTLTIIIENWAR
jgi:hypothetical protein